jgi:integrase
LELGDLDMNRQKLVIRNGKGNKVRINDMSSDLVQSLKTWLIVRGNLPKCSKVFTSNRGNPINTEHLREWLRRKLIDLKIVKKEGMCEKCRKGREDKYCKDCRYDRHLSPHSFRHMFIVFALEDNIPIQEVASIVGHADINMTWKYVNIAQMKTTYLTRFKGFNGSLA